MPGNSGDVVSEFPVSDMLIVDGLCGLTELPVLCIQGLFRDLLLFRSEEWAHNQVRVGQLDIGEHLQRP